MEYLPLSLTQCLETHQDLPLQIKYSILLDIAKGLNYLHCKRPPIVHRVLTANNILLTSNFIAKISDLGVSRMTDTFKQKQLTVTPSNAVVISPKALKDKPSYDHKLDIFSYGCLILHVFTHQWPIFRDQYKQNDLKLLDLVPEWDRRSKYTTAIPCDNPFFSFTKSCLDNDPKKRPTMSNAIICAEHALSSLPPVKNQLEMRKDISSLTEKVNQLRQMSELEQEKEQVKNNLKRLEENKPQIFMNAFTKAWQFKGMGDVNLAAKKQDIVLKLEEEMLLLNIKILSSIPAKTPSKKELRQNESELDEQKLKHSPSNEKIANLQFVLSSLLLSLLKSEDDIIEIVRDQYKGTCPRFEIQKEIIQQLILQELKEGDEW